VPVGTLLCDLIRGGYVSDKIVLRRLVKLVVCYCEQGGNITALTAAETTAAVTTEPLPVQAPQSPVVSATRSAVLHIVHAAILAELYGLGTSGDTKMTRFVASAVKAALISMIQEHQAVLSPLWFAVVVDGARLLWAASATSAPEKRAEAHQLDALFGSTSESGPPTPGSTEEKQQLLHPLRGGLTYSHAAAAAGALSSSVGVHPELSQHLLAALPAAMAAYIQSCTAQPKTPKKTSAAASQGAPALPAVPPTKVLPLFAVANTSLCRALSTANGVVDAASVEYLLSSLLVLARKDAPAQAAAGPHPYVIPLAEYTALLTACARGSGRASSEAVVRTQLELTAVIAERMAVVRKASEVSAEADACWLALWKLTTLLLHNLEPRLYSSFDAATWLNGTQNLTPDLASSGALVGGLSELSTEHVVAVVKTLTCLARAVDDAVLPYVHHVLSLLLVLCAVLEDKHSTALIVTTLAQSDTPTLPSLCAQLLLNLHDWVMPYQSTGAGAEEVAKRVADVSLTAWYAIFTRIGNPVSLLLNLWRYLKTLLTLC
jgi:hypothetical protein